MVIVDLPHLLETFSFLAYSDATSFSYSLTSLTTLAHIFSLPGRIRQQGKGDRLCKDKAKAKKEWKQNDIIYATGLELATQQPHTLPNGSNLLS